MDVVFKERSMFVINMTQTLSVRDCASDDNTVPLGVFLSYKITTNEFT